MRVVIAGAGKAGRSIAQELLISGHDVLLVDKEPEAIRPEDVPGATWLLADACELSSLEEADLESADVAVAATGDDKANLVHSCWPVRSSACPEPSRGSTIRATNGCSPRPGGWTWRSPHRG